MLWTILTLAVGMAIVVGGILVFRLHAFLALLLAAFAVAVMTPGGTIRRYHVAQQAMVIRGAQKVSSTTDPHEQHWIFVLPDQAAPSVDQVYLVARSSDSKLQPLALRLRPIGRATAGTPTPAVGSGEVRWEFVSLSARQDAEIRAGNWLVPVTEWASATEAAKATMASRVATAFGATAAKIGILIAMASIIGKCLLDSGAADRIVRSSLQWFGVRASPFAFVISGFLLGVPVFFDTVFYLMIPLGKAMALRTGKNYLLLVMAIIAGATMAHSLVPPTPGPLVVAELLGVDIGVMMLGGVLVGCCAAGAGFLYAALFANRRWTLPLRDSVDVSLEDLRRAIDRPLSDLPSLPLALLPIVLPVVLIAGYSVLGMSGASLPAPVADTAKTLGDKNVALTIAAMIAMATLIRQCRLTRRELAARIAAALNSGGTIILITSAGGAFGKMLQESGITFLVQQAPVESTPAILLFAFAVTTLIRTAQGSATVAMMTAVPVVAGLAQGGVLPFHPVYLALAIGCGSKPIPWMNDSGFWVITKMSGMSESEGLRYITPLVSLMGLVGIIVVVAAAIVLPLTG